MAGFSWTPWIICTPGWSRHTRHSCTRTLSAAGTAPRMTSWRWPALSPCHRTPLSHTPPPSRISRLSRMLALNMTGLYRCITIPPYHSDKPSQNSLSSCLCPLWAPCCHLCWYQDGSKHHCHSLSGMLDSLDLHDTWEGRKYDWRKVG